MKPIEPTAAASLSWEATKAAPPVSISLASITGLTLDNWVCILTIAYTGLLIVQKLIEMFRRWADPPIK